MSHGIDYADETITTTCPDWCDAPHDEDRTFHFSQSVGSVTDVNGGAVNVGRWWNETKREAGFYVGAHEIGYEAASALGRLLSDGAYGAALNTLGSRD